MKVKDLLKRCSISDLKTWKGRGWAEEGAGRGREKRRKGKGSFGFIPSTLTKKSVQSVHRLNRKILLVKIEGDQT